MNQDELQTLAANSLKSIARDERIKAYIQNSSDLCSFLIRASRRYVTGETIQGCISIAQELMKKGYLVSLEYIGENTRTEEECVRAKEEFVRLIRCAGDRSIQSTISLDLSHIGMSIDSELAVQHLVQLAREAALYGLTIMISMEESAKTDRILSIYKAVSSDHPNVGITLQAHLHRTLNDWHDIAGYPGRIRVVKGAYQESEAVAVSRSEELDERYTGLVEMVVSSGRPLSIATHDQSLLDQLQRRGYLKCPHVEVEMLYGIRPDLIRSLKEQGVRSKVYLTYGQEWFLYLCHRLAEYPPNIYQAVADIVEHERSDMVPY